MVAKLEKLMQLSIKAVSFLDFFFFLLAETRKYLQNNSNGLSQQWVP